VVEQFVEIDVGRNRKTIFLRAKPSKNTTLSDGIPQKITYFYSSDNQIIPNAEKLSPNSRYFSPNSRYTFLMICAGKFNFTSKNATDSGYKKATVLTKGKDQ